MKHKRVTISEYDETVLQDALAKRNYLMHRFFSVHDAELLEDERPLVNELRELSAVLAAARHTAESLYLGIIGALDSDGAMAERIFRLGAAWENVVLK